MPRVGGVETGSPADLAGFQKGDLIKSANGVAIDNFEDLHQAISTSTGLPIVFDFERAGAPMTVTATPTIADVDHSSVRQAPNRPPRHQGVQ